MSKKTTINFQKIVNTLIIIGLITCIAVLICIGIMFCSQHIRFSNSYVETCETLKSITTTENYNEIIESMERLINMLSTLQEVQNNTATTDLIVFLYSFLSTIFVGVGAYYLNNIKTKAEKAKINFEKEKQMFKKSEKLHKKSNKIFCEAKETVKRISNIRDDCSNKQSQVQQVCKELERSQSLLEVQNTYQAASLALSLSFACEKLDENIPNEKENLAELMPRLNDAVQFLCRLTSNIDPSLILPKDVEMLQFILKEIQKSLNRCTNKSSIFFTEEYVNAMGRKLKRCIEHTKNSNDEKKESN